MITLTSFQLKWLERLILYQINEDNNMQAKLSALHYEFRTGISVGTGLHEFVCRVEHCFVRKKLTLLQTPADLHAGISMRTALHEFVCRVEH